MVRCTSTPWGRSSRAHSRPRWPAGAGGGIDGSIWPRPSAGTSPARTCCHRVATGFPQDGIVPGWESQWLVAVPEPNGSWVLPLEVTRRSPASGSPTELALDQVHDVLAVRLAAAPRPPVVLDAGYDPVQLAQSKERERVDFLLRMNSLLSACESNRQLGNRSQRQVGEEGQIAARASLATAITRSRS